MKAMLFQRFLNLALIAVSAASLCGCGRKADVAVPPSSVDKPAGSLTLKEGEEVPPGVSGPMPADAISAPEPTGLVNGPESVDDLAQAIVRALNESDAAALHRVRVTEAEYSRLLFPRFPAAEPGRTVPASFHWFLLNNKSIKAARRAIAENGDQGLTYLELQNDPEIEDYGDFRLINKVRVKVSKRDGEEEWLSFLGSIVSMQGSFKMLSYRD